MNEVLSISIYTSCVLTFQHAVYNDNVISIVLNLQVANAQRFITKQETEIARQEVGLLVEKASTKVTFPQCSENFRVKAIHDQTRAFCLPEATLYAFEMDVIPVFVGSATGMGQ